MAFWNEKNGKLKKKKKHERKITHIEETRMHTTNILATRPNVQINVKLNIYKKREHGQENQQKQNERKKNIRLFAF